MGFQRIGNQNYEITACMYELQGLRMTDCPFIIVILAWLLAAVAVMYRPSATMEGILVYRETFGFVTN